MGIKMKNVNIVGFTILMGRGLTKKQLYMWIFLKRELGQLAGDLEKNREEGVFKGRFDTLMRTMA